jgi:hypothetical protein
MSRPDAKKNITTLVKAYGKNKVLREIANLVLIMGNREVRACAQWRWRLRGRAAVCVWSPCQAVHATPLSWLLDAGHPATLHQHLSPHAPPPPHPHTQVIDSMAPGSSKVLEQVLKLIDAYDLYGSVAYPKRHTQDDISDIYLLPAATRGVFVNIALQVRLCACVCAACSAGVGV